jgi:hypothetical protein
MERVMSDPINAGRLADIHEIRRLNLRLLIDEYANGNLSRFVEVALKGSTSYQGLNQVTSPRKRRNLGYMLARRIEAQLKLSQGWMDQDHSGLIVKPGTIPNGRSERVMRLAESIVALPPTRRVLVEQIVEALRGPREASHERRPC